MKITRDEACAMIVRGKENEWEYVDGSPLIFDIDHKVVLIAGVWYLWDGVYLLLCRLTKATTAPRGKFWHKRNPYWQ